MNRFNLALKTLVISIALFFSGPVAGQDLTESLFYDIGSPVLREIYVDILTGSDTNDGTTSSKAFKTVTAAWNSIPQGTTLTQTGYRINIAPGEYEASATPNYWESRYGTAQYPIILQASSGAGSAIFRSGPNVFDARYVYFIELDMIPVPAGDAFHCEQCDHVLLRGNTIRAGTRTGEVGQETLKINQSQYIYLENNNISGASDNAVDYVGVQYGHIVGNKIHDATDWCIYTKGGSAYLRIEGNEIYDCGTGGYTAGQGTGFEFMSAPWTHYEAYAIKFINNIIHDTEGAAFGVNGGFNILIANNTAYRFGTRSHAIEVVFGIRSCDGDTAACTSRNAAGGWGPGSTNIEVAIPNKNVSIYNNVLYNPNGIQTGSQHFAIYGPRTAVSGSNVPSPVTTDAGLRIRGNVLWNGSASMLLGIEESGEGCQSGNATCNADQLVADNAINTVEPQMLDPANGDFRPTGSGNLFSVTTYVPPDFSWTDLPAAPAAPAGNSINLVGRDRGSETRAGAAPPGAYVSAASPLVPTGAGVPSVPTDGGTSSNVAPTVRGIKGSAKIKGKKVTITVSATVTDDAGISTVTASIKPKAGTAKSGTLRRKGSTNVYSAKITTSGKKGKAAIVVMAIDTGSKTTSKKKSVTVK